MPSNSSISPCRVETGALVFRLGPEARGDGTNFGRSGKTARSPEAVSGDGPGLITGASDDDPSGVATYSQVGAQFGYGLVWTLVLSYPLMAAIQEISARIGRVTGFGIAGNLRRHYPSWLSGSVVTLLLLVVGWLATIAMAATVVALVWSWFE
jgi:Mn2+/Fe2+ NRAMP family transporter